MVMVCQLFADTLSTSEMGVRFWGGLDGRDAYDVALLRAVLDATISTHGGYDLVVEKEAFGDARGRREIELGNLVNVYNSPLRQDSISRQERVIPVLIPTMKGLLGYRALAVREESFPRVAKIESLPDLAEFKLGQGRGWVDIAIYRYNKIPVVEAAVYPLLFSMLSRERIELLPLGIGEMDDALAVQVDEFPSLKKYPHLILYYPFPTVFQVSAKYPKLAERIEFGLSRLQDNGKASVIFEAHFSELLESYKRSNPKVIRLENPLIESDLGLTYPDLLD